MKLLENKFCQLVLVLLAYIAISYAYLYPGGGYMLEGNTQLVMSDGTDPTAAPNSYAQVEYALEHNFTHLLYGALPSNIYSGPEGMAAWYFWYEKLVAIIALKTVNLEQATTMIVWISYVIDALAFYFMGLLLGWKKPISFTGGLCWAFCAYTRGRAKVHMALVSTYFLPVLFIGFILLKRQRSKKDIYLASIAFFLTALSAQYYVMMTAFMAPILLYYYFSETKKSEIKFKIICLILAALPAVSLLAWTVLKPIPAGSLNATSIYPKTGEAPEGQVHPFLNRFSARPIDYISGDIAIGVKDLNPLRYFINRHVVENLDGSNYHERANGIRWSILILSLLAIWAFYKKRDIGLSKSKIHALVAIGSVGFVLSLGANWFGYDIGPSVLLNKWVSQFRVTSRASLFVNFSLLVLACSYISTLKSKKWLWAFPLIALIELPPFLNPMPISFVQPEYKSLTQHKEDGACGLGMYYPYVSGQWQTMSYYIFLQRTRTARCPSLNSANLNDREINMINYFPLHPDFVALIVANQPVPKQQLQAFVRCASLSWVAFDPVVPPQWRAEVCAGLGWRMTESDVCKSPSPVAYPSSFNKSCIGMK